MALAPGTRFGSYEVVEQIGSGGMGEVWGATDTTLKRDVALKVLPQAFVEDADRLARFRREAEILASLNHPNIATIHGLEDVDGQTVIVMELVEGPTLEDRIREGRLPVDEAMNIALQIASALETAHGRQIVHRDLKPANVKIREDGTVKVLDFGISKPIDPSAISGGTPVGTTPALTQTGVILGTAAYMSPEQARGRFVDQRTDIWAFGCLLFEMLTGQPAFGGEDVMAILARVIDRDTDLSSMPGTISPAVRHTIRKCLEKDPRKRIADIRDVRLALEGEFWPAAAQAPVRRQALPWALTFLFAFIAAVAALTAFLADSGPQAGPVIRAVIEREANTSPGVDISGVRDIAISPDGTRIVYGAGQRRGPLLVQSLDRFGSEPLVGTTGGSSPVFSPDGREIAFFSQSDGALKRIAVRGGPVSFIAAVEGIPAGLSWGPNDTIVFATQTSGGLMRVPATGGEPERLTAVDAGQGESEHRWPSVLSNGRGALFTAWHGTTEQSTLAVVAFGTNEVTYLPLNGSHPIVAPTGHLLYASDGALRAVGFDAQRFALTTGTAVPVIEQLRTQPTGAAQFDVAASGSLVYVRDVADEPVANTLVWVDRSGREEPISLMPRPYINVRVSPEGDRIVAASDVTVWVSDRGFTRLSEIPLGPGVTGGWWPLWSPNGRRVAFQSGPAVVWGSADGGGGVEPLVIGASGPVNVPDSWAAGGRSLLFTYGADGNLRIGVLDMDTEEWRPLIDRGRSVSSAAVAPSGDWLAYWDNDSDDIYVERYPELGDRQLVSGEAGGTQPAWAADGRELYYVRPDGAMMAVRIDTTAPSLELGTPELLFRTDGYGAEGIRGWDIAPDGRFLMVKVTGVPWATDQNRSIIHVQNWLQELQRLAPLP